MGGFIAVIDLGDSFTFFNRQLKGDTCWSDVPTVYFSRDQLREDMAKCRATMDASQRFRDPTYGIIEVEVV